ncbi:OmpW/AlkL family protein [Aquitalea aquatica]|uniref:OmpW family protein n=1 Tax=Aquitalea aquatica TaxID=3044273 RepID=A0A838Y9G1_9NEIS|nr:OmpW family outer membrane protein [Aquitalea magnusonii]MBA4710042.1 OmpW family protein [Aquitalea magnusonii]
MKKLALAAAIGLISASAFAAQGDILARFRVINVNPDVSADSTLSAIHTDVKSDTVPEFDFTYMITNNIGAELILGTSRHEVNSDLGSLGKVSVLPPTLTLQYHFMPEATFRPYVGVGVNYTRFYNNGLKVGSTAVDIDQNSWGLAAQVGADVAISKNLFINFDVKKIDIKTKARLNGADLGTLKINPWVYGIGIGTKF